MMTETFAAVAFGLSAWLGAALARALCSGRVPFDDGPPPVRVRTSLVVLAGACVGIGLATHHLLSPVQLSCAVLVVIALAACTVSDLLLGVVPDLFTLTPLVVLLLAAAARRDYSPLLSAAVVAAPFAAAAVISRGYGMGWGDVKLAALGGAVLGPQESLLAFALASLVALVVSRAPSLRGRPIAFAPYLAGGIGTMLAVGVHS